ncbi:maleylpyruvate isomerase N-terminal domain-containing protein [Nocardioides sp. AX2bis]|uniref:maleylpyruvate isomerase N-terminal domain-containing protein n=1 Tax=Nocardioides sp. AX2bis TaxID=2653157 RepID=UPI0019167A9A|nr:maleylpyruvate isomerase N-terminal domain-containing protein [Nocardioides sp. AX2bis]
MTDPVLPTPDVPSSPEPDPVLRWRAAADRVCDLVLAVASETPAVLERHVPACPDWTARDLLSHMVGLATDVLDGDEPDDHNPGWTDRQVARRKDRDVTELVEEWRAHADGLVAWMRENGSRPLNDVVIHEQDLRGALDRPGARDTPELTIVRERMADRFAGTVVDLPPIALVGPGWTWVNAGTVEEAPTRLEADDFDLARALSSRRTEAQLRSWTVRGDVGAYLPALAGLGDLPVTPLPE